MEEHLVLATPYARLKNVLVRTVARSGVPAILRRFYGGLGAVLAFHRVLPDREAIISPGHSILTDHLAEILVDARERGYRFVSLDEIPELLESGSRDPFLAFTLDDGFSDTLHHAAPIFRKFQAPFAVFPVVDFLNRVSKDWWLLLQSIVTRASRLELRVSGGRPIQIKVVRPLDRMLALQRISDSLAEGHQLEQAVEIADRAGIDIPRALDEDFLSWTQLQELSRDPLVTIGTHTMSHQALALLDSRTASREIRGATKELERRLEIPIRHIAYPFGSPAACRERDFQLAADAGLVCGYTTTRGNLFRRHCTQLHSLPRHTISSLPHSSGVDYVRASLDGLWDSPLNNRYVARMRA
jgi:peptidoglycan/xylan/chitin deacetylase (PgdA/CDA1 family)